MSATLAISGGNAKTQGATSCMQTCNSLQTNVAVMRAARASWGRKAVTILQQLTGRSERTVRYWSAGQSEISTDDLARMMRSEDGLVFLSALMGDSKPRWWRAFKAQVAAHDAQRLQRAAVRQLQEAIDANADLCGALARAEALSDQDFMRPHVDAQRAMAGVPHRAMAAAAGGGRRSR